MFPRLILMPTGDNQVRLLAHGHDGYAILGAECYGPLADAGNRHKIVPPSLVTVARQQFGLDITGQTIEQALIIRLLSEYGFQHASWELNWKCNYRCPHCFLGPKPSHSLSLEQRIAVLDHLVKLGVWHLQLTGGEPLIDCHFRATYEAAYLRGILLRVSTNGSNLSAPLVLDLLKNCPPLHVAVSVYGASAPTYEAVSQQVGSFERFRRGVDAALAAGIRVRLNIIETTRNCGEVADMVAMAQTLGCEHHVYRRMSPTYYGDGGVLKQQSTRIELRPPKEPYCGCGAGRTSLHIDPSGQAFICKMSRDDGVAITDGPAFTAYRLGQIAELALARDDDCQVCPARSACGSCPPLVKRYQEAGASAMLYCSQLSDRR